MLLLTNLILFKLLIYYFYLRDSDVKCVGRALIGNTLKHEVVLPKYGSAISTRYCTFQGL